MTLSRLYELNLAARETWQTFQALQRQTAAEGTDALATAEATWRRAEARFGTALDTARGMPAA